MMYNLNHKIMCRLVDSLWVALPTLAGSSVINIVDSSGKISNGVLLRSKMLYNHPLLRSIDSAILQQNTSS